MRHVAAPVISHVISHVIPLAMACFLLLPDGVRAQGRQAEESEAQDTPAQQDLFRAWELRGHAMLMEGPGELAAFTTDGCSGGMSAGWALVATEFPDLAGRTFERPPWEACCVTHDRHYHNAGSARTAEESYAARLAADEALRACVTETGARRQAETMDRLGLTASQTEDLYALVAQGMYRAVRIGGGPCTRLPWRWGYGYPQC